MNCKTLFGSTVIAISFILHSSVNAEDQKKTSHKEFFINHEIAEYVCKNANPDETIQKLCNEIKQMRLENGEKDHNQLDNDKETQNITPGVFDDIILFANAYLDYYDPLFKGCEGSKFTQFTKSRLVNHLIFMGLEAGVVIGIFAAYIAYYEAHHHPIQN